MRIALTLCIRGEETEREKRPQLLPPVAVAGNTIKKHRAEEEEPPAVLNAHVFTIFPQENKKIDSLP